jgi:hypothetical protein
MARQRETPQEKKLREYSERVSGGNRRNAEARKKEKLEVSHETRNKANELLAQIKPQISHEDAEVVAGELTSTHLQKSVSRRRVRKDGAAPLRQVIEWHLEKRIYYLGRKRKITRPNPKYDKWAREAVETLTSIPKEIFADVARRAGQLCSPEHRYQYQDESFPTDPLDRALCFLQRLSGGSTDENQALGRNKEVNASLTA